MKYLIETDLEEATSKQDLNQNFLYVIILASYGSEVWGREDQLFKQKVVIVDILARQKKCDAGMDDSPGKKNKNGELIQYEKPSLLI